MKKFKEQIFTKEDEKFIGGVCDVIVSEDGYFVSIITDDYEGHAQMTLPLAIKVYEALGRAIQHAEGVSKDKAQ